MKKIIIKKNTKRNEILKMKGGGCDEIKAKTCEIWKKWKEREKTKMNEICKEIKKNINKKWQKRKVRKVWWKESKKKWWNKLKKKKEKQEWCKKKIEIRKSEI